MNNKEYIAKLFAATVISIVIFILLTILSYFLNLEHRVNFKIGLPWTFYYQFMVDGDVQFGTDLRNFIKDASLTWILTTVLWLAFKRKNKR